eukprot:137171-Chlamydomonas_euryale.AAC.1
MQGRDCAGEAHAGEIDESRLGGASVDVRQRIELARSEESRLPGRGNSVGVRVALGMQHMPVRLPRSLPMSTLKTECPDWFAGLQLRVAGDVLVVEIWWGRGE